MDMMDLLGKEVVDLNGSVIGVVKNAIFDQKMWQVLSLEVYLNDEIAKEFDLKKMFQSYLVLLEPAQIQGVGDKITLKTDRSELMTLLSPPGSLADTPKET